MSTRGLVRRNIPRETGYVDLASASYACDTTGSITLLATIAQGASVEQRIGKKVMLKSLQARGDLRQGTTAVVNDVAFMIVYDKRPGGALPAITDILESVNPKAMNNDNNASRFSILKRVDKVLIGDTSSAVDTNSATACDVTFFLPINRHSIFNAAGTGAIGDIDEGALYLVTVGGTAAGTAAATLTVAFRTRFLDM